MTAFPPLHGTLALRVEETSGIGEARRIAMRFAEHIGFGEEDAGRVGLVVTEAATNMVNYAEQGQILLQRWDGCDVSALEIIAIDKGPGIPDVGLALRDGYSTAVSSGVGLGAIRRLSTQFEIYCPPRQGTAILARVAPAKAVVKAPAVFEWGGICVPKRDELECGDAWSCALVDGQPSVVVLDGLGHGREAWEASLAGIGAFNALSASSPSAIIDAIHAALRATRGAVGFVAKVDLAAGKVVYAGIGNIAAAIVPVDGKKAAGLVSYNGTLGHAVRKHREHHSRWGPDSLFMAHSDGVSQRWSLGSYPGGLVRRAPSLVSAILYRDFASGRDDSVVVVGRETTAEVST